MFSGVTPPTWEISHNLRSLGISHNQRNIAYLRSLGISHNRRNIAYQNILRKIASIPFQGGWVSSCVIPGYRIFNTFKHKTHPILDPLWFWFKHIAIVALAVNNYSFNALFKCWTSEPSLVNGSMVKWLSAQIGLSKISLSIFTFYSATILLINILQMKLDPGVWVAAHPLLWVLMKTKCLS